MRLSLFTVSVLFALTALVAAWSKEGNHLSGLLLGSLLRAVTDHEIFRVRDEVAASEGQDVTFYGTRFSQVSIWIALGLIFQLQTF